MAGYRDLKVWQASMSLAEGVYKLCAKFPKHEIYGLISQLQRAAVSIPSNIAEGQARNSNNEFRRFLSIALGSLAELETQLILAHKLEYLESDEVNIALSKADEIGKMLKGLQNSLVSTSN